MTPSKPTFGAALLTRWAWSMAWRESRRSRIRLLLFSSSIVLGVGAMVAVGSFGANLSQAVEDQSKALLGADLEVRSRSPFTEEQRRLLDGLGDERSYQTSFTTMLAFEEQDATRLVQLRALGGAFPFYGSIEAAPQEGVSQFRRGVGVLVEENLMLQFEAEVGDPVKVGDLSLPIVGAPQSVPGGNMVFAAVAPRVFFPRQRLEESGLVGDKSIARYRCYLRVGGAESLQAAMAEIEEVREDYRWSVDDVDERKEDLGDALRNLYRFLNLAAFVALLLGAIGIASAIQLHIRKKLESVAILRCMGCASGQTFAIYLIQAAVLGVVGVLAGTVLALVVQRLLPVAFAEFLPFEIEYAIYWGPMARGALLGFGISLLFALLPLLPVRRVSPLQVLRRAEVSVRDRRLEWGIYGIIVLVVTLFAISQSEPWWHGIGFTGGLGLALLILLGVSRSIGWSARRLIQPGWPYVIRQGMANLYRPNNRTGLLMLALGLGTFLILTLHLTQYGVVKELFPEAQEDQANAILFDVQSDQVEGIRTILEEQSLPVLGEEPVISMRIASINGRSVAELREDPERRIPRWALRREYRSTFRRALTDTESLQSGTWVPQANFDDAIIPVSVEEGIARDLGVTLGDEIEFDVQGIVLLTEVKNIRVVDWRRVQANFFFVFPAGVLDDAPGFHIVTTRLADPAASARMQRAVVDRYPNVSTIDLMLVLEIVTNIVDKISFGIRFMAFFTALTGVLLLVSATVNSRYQRLHESIQLRALGASRGQILKIQIAEYCLLGLMASLTGVALAVGGAWVIVSQVFEVSFQFPLLQVGVAVVLNCLLTVGVGMFGSWGVTRHSPLVLLREGG